jgi:CHAT domain-containing protein
MILTGRDASEPRFKQQAPNHRVLHVATHGFFLGESCEPQGVAGSRSVGGLTRVSQREAAALNENPLLLSGLALAGANRRMHTRADDEDGILTAEEVAGLNLDGVDWAVLSACDTGLGQLAAGEGVVGLRRAFQIAGARTVIMSLWSIDDQAARQWMRVLYQDRLAKRLSTSDAVRDATISVLRARRARGESTHPFYWGGFVAAGEWR